MRVCIPWRRDGILSGMEVFPKRAPDAHVRIACSVRPLNGRQDKPETRLTFSKSVRARAIACARVALRVCDVFMRCLSRRPSYLKYYFKSKVPFKRIRVRLHAWGTLPYRRVFRLVSLVCTRVVYMALCVVKSFLAYRLLYVQGI